MKKTKQGYFNDIKLYNINKKYQMTNKRSCVTATAGKLPFNMLVSDTAYKRGFENNTSNITHNNYYNIRECYGNDSLTKLFNYKSPESIKREDNNESKMKISFNENGLEQKSFENMENVVRENKSYELYDISTYSSLNNSDSSSPFSDYCYKFENRELPNGFKNYYASVVSHSENEIEINDDLHKLSSKSYFDNSYNYAEGLIEIDEMYREKRYSRNSKSQRTDNISRSSYFSVLPDKKNNDHNLITCLQYTYTDTSNSKHMVKKTDIKYTLYE